jgi:hypothetical protein
MNVKKRSAKARHKGKAQGQSASAKPERAISNSLGEENAD